MYGGWVYSVSDSNPVITNCIVWGNLASYGNQVSVRSKSSSSPSRITVSYSDIQGGMLIRAGGLRMELRVCVLTQVIRGVL